MIGDKIIKIFKANKYTLYWEGKEIGKKPPLFLLSEGLNEDIKSMQVKYFNKAQFSIILVHDTAKGIAEMTDIVKNMLDGYKNKIEGIKYIEYKGMIPDKQGEDFATLDFEIIVKY